MFLKSYISQVYFCVTEDARENSLVSQRQYTTLSVFACHSGLTLFIVRGSLKLFFKSHILQG